MSVQLIVMNSMKKILNLFPSFNFPFSSAAPAAMPCPFLSRLSTTFVKNYSGKLLKTYSEHCPVMTKHGVTASGLPTVEISYGTTDDIEVRETPSK